MRLKFIKPPHLRGYCANTITFNDEAMTDVIGRNTPIRRSGYPLFIGLSTRAVS